MSYKDQFLFNASFTKAWNKVATDNSNKFNPW